MTVHWKRNIFRVQQGNIGKQFVDELARLYAAFADGSALESVSLKAIIVIPHLLLQKPHHSSKTKENISCLKRRMELWKDGDLASLLKEALTIQHRLKKFYQQKKTSNNPARQFADLVFQGKIKQALEMLSKEGSGGILRLDDTFNTNGTTRSVKDTLKLKHPPSQPADPEVCIQGNPPEVHHVTYDAINATLIRSTALQVRGTCVPLISKLMTGGDCVHPFNPPLIHYVKHWQDVPNVFAPHTSTIKLCLLSYHAVSLPLTNARASAPLALVTLPGESCQRPSSKL